jgi:hypothetical protein
MHPYRAGDLTTGNAIPHTHSPFLFSCNDYERLMPCSLSLSFTHTHVCITCADVFLPPVLPVRAQPDAQPTLQALHRFESEHTDRESLLGPTDRKCVRNETRKSFFFGLSFLSFFRLTESFLGMMLAKVFIHLSPSPPLPLHSIPKP